uniref:Uncharacterized protein n=1 Tax=Strongyloides venezuelensis TaxID=75913 RepID=A0A0K0FW11_STRVS
MWYDLSAYNRCEKLSLLLNSNFRNSIYIFKKSFINLQNKSVKTLRIYVVLERKNAKMCKCYFTKEISFVRNDCLLLWSIVITTFQFDLIFCTIIHLSL